jgi:hypothetical protein
MIGTGYSSQKYFTTKERKEEMVPGTYEMIRDSFSTHTIFKDSYKVEKLHVGKVISVREIKVVETEKRIRGRLNTKPESWMTLKNMETGEFFVKKRNTFTEINNPEDKNNNSESWPWMTLKNMETKKVFVKKLDKLTNAHSHILKEFKTSQNICDGCERDIRDETMYGCRECNYDLCESCKKSEKSVKTIQIKSNDWFLKEQNEKLFQKIIDDYNACNEKEVYGRDKASELKEDKKFKIIMMVIRAKCLGKKTK